MIKIYTQNKKNLKKKDIYEICKLKNSFWKYGINENLKWFKKNVKNNDLNILIKKNNKIIGYTLLRKRKLKVDNKTKYYLYLDTIIISKSERKKNFGDILIRFNNLIIEQYNCIGILICERGNIGFYKKFGWNVIPKNKCKFINKDIRNLKSLIYNNKYKKKLFLAI